MNPLWYAESMIDFRHIDDIEDYLEPMDYETFWQEIKGFCLILIPRDKCDSDIEDGVDEETILIVLKNLARIELASILKLKWRCDVPMRTMH